MVMPPRLVSHLRSGQVSRIVYGSIIGLALVLTMEVHPPGIARTIGSLLATAVAVGLAELYSEYVGARARDGLGGARESTGKMAEASLAVAFGIAFPAVFFLAAGLKLIDYGTAFNVATWSGLALISGYGYAAARLSGTSHPKSLVHAVAVGLIAAVLIVLKALVH